MKLLEWKKLIEASTNRKKIISFINGVPDKRVILLYLPLISRIIKNLLKTKKDQLFNYASSQGNFELRRGISKLMLKDKYFNEDEILITSGSQQGWKLICETLLKSGDIVMLECPTYIGVEKPLMDKGVRIECFSEAINTYDNVELERQVAKNKPKLVYLIPDFSNPCGTCIALEKRKLLIELAKKYKFIIVEDQTYRYLFFNESELLPTISSMFEKTIVLGTVSKIVVPGIRIGWIATNNINWLEELLLTKESTDLSSSNLDQQIAAEVLRTINGNKEIFNKVREIYARKMRILVDYLEKYADEYFEWVVPKGGFYIWLNCKNKINTDELFNKCIKRGVGIAPGSIFYLKNVKNYEFRLSISDIREKEITAGLKVILKSLGCKNLPKVDKKVNYLNLIRKMLSKR